jgi:hypothetical protein
MSTRNIKIIMFLGSKVRPVRRADSPIIYEYVREADLLCGLVVRILGYRSGGPGSIPGTTRKKNVVGLERGALSLVSTN